MAETGTVLEIQHQCIHDGDGVRSVLFLKGCPLCCLWCANPESQTPQAQIGVDRARCIGDGACVAACRFHALQPGPVIDDTLCTGCGECAAVCYSGAIKQYGRTMNLPSVMSELLKDRVFFRSGGGVTLSGGEPFFQERFANAVLHALREAGVHTAVETCGHAAWNSMRDAPVDQFLFDLKHMDADKHREYTGVSNDLILQNLHALVAHGKQVVLRMPLIPGYNDSTQNLNATTGLMKDLGLQTLHLLPFHQLGSNKYRLLRQAYPLEEQHAATQDEITRAAELLKKMGVRVVTGG